jgi:hypothetical protein
MNRNWSWQGWVAIALAGLALVVALGGRSSWGNQRQMMPMWSQQQPQQAQPAQPAPQVQAPNNSSGQNFGRGHRGMMDNGQGMMGNGQGMMGRGDKQRGGGMMMGRSGMPGIFGMLFGLAKIVGLGLLAWLLFRMFTQRRNAAQPPATPLTPAGHDPSVE